MELYNGRLRFAMKAENDVHLVSHGKLKIYMQLYNDLIKEMYSQGKYGVIRFITYK